MQVLALQKGVAEPGLGSGVAASVPEPLLGWHVGTSPLAGGLSPQARAGIPWEPGAGGGRARKGVLGEEVLHKDFRVCVCVCVWCSGVWWVTVENLFGFLKIKRHISSLSLWVTGPDLSV